MDYNDTAPIELDKFPSRLNSKVTDGCASTQHKGQVVPVDTDSGISNRDDFDPFKERKVAHPTTDFDSLAHLLKACFGTGILAMPCAFRSSGLIVGVVASILIGSLSTHCAYILVSCAHVLYHKAQKTEMNFAEVAETALAVGPKGFRKFSKFARHGTQTTLFIAYFGTSSVLAVIAAENFRKVIDRYFGSIFIDGISERGSIAFLLLPLILLSWIPDLKYLAPVSIIANGFMAISLCIIFYWIFNNFASGNQIKPENFKLIMPIEEFPKFFSITIFATVAIGVIMQIENEMKTPQHFIGVCGVLNKGMFGIILVYIVVGVLGYMNDPNSKASMITLEMPVEETPSQVVRILVGLEAVCTLRLLFNVCLDIAWNWIKDCCTKKPLVANYILRTSLMIGCVLLAVAVPTIAPFMGFIGAFCFSIQAFMIPVFIETLTYWDIGFGSCKWKAIKNIIITIVAILALIFGSNDAIREIINLYSQNNGTRTVDP